MEKRWTGTIHLNRQPYCPRCAAPLHPNAWTVVTAVAFCSRCTLGWLYPILKDAQFAHTPPLAPHTTEISGITFYTPKTHTVIPLFRMADRLKLTYPYSILPVDANLQPIHQFEPSLHPLPRQHIAPCTTPPDVDSPTNANT